MKIVAAIVALLLFASPAHADSMDDNLRANEIARSGDYAAAERLTTESLARGPSGFASGWGIQSLHHTRSLLRTLLGNTSGAIEDAKVLVQTDSMGAPADMGYAALILAHAVAGDAAAVDAAFQAGHELAKGRMASEMRSAGLYANRGVARILLGDLARADADLAHALSLDMGWVGSVDGYESAVKKSWTEIRGTVALMQAGNHKAAGEAARAALQTLRNKKGAAGQAYSLAGPALILARLERAEAKRVEVRQEEVLLLAQQQLAAGNRTGAFQTYVRAYGELTAPDAREKAFQGITLLHPTLAPPPGLPEDARRQLVQARVIVEEKNYAGAIALYDKALTAAPWWAPAHFDRALLVAQVAGMPRGAGNLGGYDQAIASMKRYLALAPAGDHAREAQDRIYEWELRLERERRAIEERQTKAGASATLRQPGSSGCFIATAAYGSPLAAQVEALRRFRDTRLLTHAPGRWLVARYYEVSPPLAEFIRERPLLRTLVRALLAPVLWAIREEEEKP